MTPPDPGDGYRLLKPPQGRFSGEKIKKGDEVFHNGEWKPTTAVGMRQGVPGLDFPRRRKTGEIKAAESKAVLLADEIAEYLFTDGVGTKAQRLSLLGVGGAEMGGWNQKAVAWAAKKILQKGGIE